MVRTVSYGTESAANKAIGGVPVIHYLDFQSRGRGQVVRTLLIDAGAAYKDVRYGIESEWSANKNTEKIARLNPSTTLPIIEMPDGKILVQSYAIVRHWARQLGAYEGKTEDEKYWADAICDIVIDWRTKFVAAFFTDDKSAYPEFKKNQRAMYLSALEKHLLGSDLSSRGPYIIGNEVTYADFVLFQILHDENLIQDGAKDLKGYPRLAKLATAVQARPNIKKFMESDVYEG